MDTIKNFKYKKINKFLNSFETNILKDYCRIKHRLNRSSFDSVQSDNFETYFYGDPLMEALLINKNSHMEELTGLSLKPTYAFWRMYTKFSDLKPHKDREACEISVTVNLGGDILWPFYVNGISFNLEPGDAVIYLGKVSHWRKEFEGDWCAQTFLHYVDANGPYKEHWKDKRIKWGETKI